MMNQQQNPAFTLINVTLLQMWLTLLTPRPLRPAVLLLIQLACGQKSVGGGGVMLGKSIERRKAVNN